MPTYQAITTTQAPLIFRLGGEAPPPFTGFSAAETVGRVRRVMAYQEVPTASGLISIPRFSRPSSVGTASAFLPPSPPLEGFGTSLGGGRENSPYFAAAVAFTVLPDVTYSTTFSGDVKWEVEFGPDQEFVILPTSLGAQGSCFLVSAQATVNQRWRSVIIWEES